MSDTMAEPAVNVLRLRIVKVDFYMSEKPITGLDQLYCDFKGVEITTVPVIRIFGVTESGKKGCLHVHGYWPYFYIPFEAQRYIDKQSFIQRLAIELDQNLVNKRNADGVHMITSLKSLPYYGYHPSSKQFLKVEFYNPNHLRRAIELLQKGSIMGQDMAVHEGHIPYILKFFIDYNLFGMNFINVENFVFRSLDDSLSNRYPPNQDYNNSTHLLKKMTSCELEADCKLENILNAKEMANGIASNPGLKAIWTEERQRRITYGMSTDICPPLSQERTNYPVMESERKFLEKLRECISNKTRNCNRQSHSSQSSFSQSNESVAGVQQSPCTLDNMDTNPRPDPLDEDESDNEDRDDLISAEMTQKFADIYSKQTLPSHPSLLPPPPPPMTEQSSISNSVPQGSPLNLTVEPSTSRYTPVVQQNPQYQPPNQPVSCQSNNTNPPYSSTSSGQNFHPRVYLHPHPSQVQALPQSNQSSSNEYPSAHQIQPSCSFQAQLALPPAPSQQQQAPVFRSSQPHPAYFPNYAPPPLTSSYPQEPRSQNQHQYQHQHRQTQATQTNSARVYNPSQAHTCQCAINECCNRCSNFDSDESMTPSNSQPGWNNVVPQIDGSFEELRKFGKQTPKNGRLRLNPLRNVRKNGSNQSPKDQLVSASSPSKKVCDIAPTKTFQKETKESRERKKAGFAVLDEIVRDLKNCKSKLVSGTEEESNDGSSTSKADDQTSEERVPRCVNGLTVYVPKSLNEEIFSKMGKECVINRNIGSSQLKEISEVSRERILEFLKGDSSKSSQGIDLSQWSLESSELRGKERTEYLLSLCKPLQVIIENEDITKDVESSQEQAPSEVCTSSASMDNQIEPDCLIISESSAMTNSIKGSINPVERVDGSLPSTIEPNVETDEYMDSGSDTTIIEQSEAKDPEKNLEAGSRDQEIFSDANTSDTEVLSIINQSKHSRDDSGPIQGKQQQNILQQESVERLPPREPEDDSPSSQLSDGVFSFYNYNDASQTIYTQIPSQAISEVSSSQLLSQSFAPPSEEHLHSTPQTKTRPRRRSRPLASPAVASPSLQPIPEKEEIVTKTTRSSRSKTRKDHLSTSENSTNNQSHKDPKRQSYDSLIEGVTRDGSYNFALASYNSASKGSAKSGNYSQHEFQYLTTMSLEVLATADKDLNPDPARNAIRAVFYAIMNDVPPESPIKPISLGMIVIDTDGNELAGCNESVLFSLRRKLLARSGFSRDSVETIYASNEIDMLTKFVSIVRKHDPDILVGYEIELSSWAYLLQRAEFLNVSIAPAISRVSDEKYARCTLEYDLDFRTGIQIPGRIVLNLWRIIRKEIKLNIYTYENVHFHVLHQRVPAYSYQNLCGWFDSPNNLNRWRVLEHYLLRVEGCLKIIDKLNIIAQTSELARLFGIQFYDVLSRGTQFRVESMMFRSAKPLDYMLFSPSVQQRSRMRVFECLPLIMEPEANYYADPIVVLDFQSLYPSVMIGYNYCYSTCLGRVENIVKEEQIEFGCTSLYLPTHILKQHISDIHVSPCGVAFLKSNVRRGVIPQMLEEILTTRIMVKNSIKLNNKRPEPSKSLHKILDARQLGLKLISNVTYGYTSASFSGRMPCVEIADSIVSKGREILERAIEMIDNHPTWGGKVVYGDTDSLFIHFPGLSRAEAFNRGHEMVLAITHDNPYPIKLKFEKVYQPCVLQTKKRYVGFMWETMDQKEGILEAKGNEAIRRDTVPAASKILEKSLKILFTTQNIDGEVKPYVQRQFMKILKGRIGCLQDYIFAREYRGMERYTPNACVPALKIAKKLRETNPRAEPLRKERVPYVITYGTPEQPLIQLVRTPLELIQNPYLRLNGTYYIERVIIPTLNRIFMLMSIDVMKWYSELPRVNLFPRSVYLQARDSAAKPRTLPQYFAPGQCPACGQKAINDDICSSCSSQPDFVAINLKEEIRLIEKKFHAIVSICKSCTGNLDLEPNCISVDCPQLFKLSQAKLDLHNVAYYEKLLEKFPAPYRH
ncbi:DNA polymerase zeta catalytic subunit isoform X3 [Brevipalpus obovatus]|uniref:DNA polymerase zeta catalytic subunit isoform X3 n=1 Tax=Brevipalpus obovatus TaxID=246614 RepID=UPI003D9E66B3